LSVSKFRQRPTFGCEEALARAREGPVLIAPHYRRRSRSVAMKAHFDQGRSIASCETSRGQRSPGLPPTFVRASRCICCRGKARRAGRMKTTTAPPTPTRSSCCAGCSPLASAAMNLTRWRRSRRQSGRPHDRTDRRSIVYREDRRSCAWIE
jgi:hypothetical protein